MSGRFRFALAFTALTMATATAVGFLVLGAAGLQFRPDFAAVVLVTIAVLLVNLAVSVRIRTMRAQRPEQVHIGTQQRTPSDSRREN